MLIQPITVSPWQSNCYVVRVDETATEALIIDPGFTARQPVIEYLETEGLRPVAMCATHGHFDHIGDAHALAAAYSIPLFLASPDHHLVTHPGEGLGPHGDAIVERLIGSAELPEVGDLRDFEAPMTLAGLSVIAFSAPGHTPGSTLLTVGDGKTSVVFTGDVIFQGTIGRTDLGGGSMSQMRASLARIVQSFPRDAPLLPGHGGPTQLGTEIDSNPYLQPENL